ncbi:spore germination protein KC [Geomicrobium halophilum]|uniref:Spore germination protein KC n=1 Tax=Geomicrobium halophilum TaxID=549000 RepID=A0A841PPU1_9BACL|nr:Ger(x)C family spore germination protein [Geomicrobium halophilum]MBB6450759.1 spore germination protein KC [Geomicrobium halophilum]
MSMFTRKKFSQDQQQNKDLSSSLAANLNRIKQRTGNSQDIVTRTLTFGRDPEIKAAIVYVEGIVDDRTIKVLIISEDVARDEGITFVMDAIERGLEFRTTTTVVIARDTSASELAKVLTGIDQIPGEKVADTLETIEKTQGTSVRNDIQEVIKHLISTEQEPLIGGFTLEGNAEQGRRFDNIQVSDFDAKPIAGGIAVFKEGKLIDWLDGEMARGLQWVLDEIEETMVNVDWEDEEEAITYRVLRENTDVSSEMQEGFPKISIDVRAEGDIREAQVPVDLMNPHVLFDIEEALETEIEKEIESTVQYVQQQKADVIGFGETVHQSHSEDWKDLEEEWMDVHLPELDVEVNVDVFIRRTGLRNNPILFEIENNQ